MTTPNDLSDKALAVFAFESGDAVSGVTARDAAGHQANRQALDELERLDLAHAQDGRIAFTAAGQLMLSQLLDRLRGSW